MFTEDCTNPIQREDACDTEKPLHLTGEQMVLPQVSLGFLVILTLIYL